MTPPQGRRRTGAGIRRTTLSGWLFIAPVVVLLGLFLVVPVLMAAWVSVSDWTGRGSPFARTSASSAPDNYRAILDGGGLDTRTSGRRCATTSTTCCSWCRCRPRWRCSWRCSSTQRMLRGRGFFRTAFYFPSVTSSVAITVLWLFLFSATGA